MSFSLIRKPIEPKIVDNFFAKRTIVYSSVSELESLIGTELSFPEKLLLKKIKRKYQKELRQNHLLEECDLITLTNGEDIKAIVLEVGASEIKYKKCENKNGPTYSIARSDVFIIRYANGTKDFFGKQEKKENSSSSSQSKADLANEMQTDGFATASIATAGTAFLLAMFVSALFGLILGPLAIIFAFISWKRIKKSKGAAKGKGLATAGLLIGAATLILSLVVALTF